MRIFVFLLLAGFTHLSIADEHKRVLRYFAADQHTFLFVTDALKLAIEKNPELHSVEVENLTYVENDEGKTLALLNRNIIDIFWVGTSIQREKEYEAVRFPLFRGLLGYRNFLTHKDNVALFDNISEHQLKALVACQGKSWPDTDILSANGYTVATASKYMQLIKLTNIKRCDYFPRAIYEGLNEIAWLADKYPDIRLVDNVMIAYQFPIYFFVRKSDHKLARKIEKGLFLAVSDGSYQALFEQHNSLKYLRPFKQWKDSTIFRLTNPLLPESAPKDELLWLQLQD